MQILLIAATSHEITLAGELNNGVDIEITGVGAPATMYHLQKRLQQIDYDIVIQAGIAGTFNSEYKLGEVVIVKQDTFADIGMEESSVFTSIYQTGLADKNEFPFIDGWLVNDHPVIAKQKIPLAKAVTINKVSDSELQKQQLIRSFSPGIESMEGAALHYICLQENIPFIQVRSVSNEVGIRDKSKWKMKEAITNLNTELINLIKLLGK